MYWCDIGTGTSRVLHLDHMAVSLATSPTMGDPSRDILPKAMAANPHKGTDIRPNRDMSNNNSRTTKVRFS
jgi:hypothetical protein